MRLRRFGQWISFRNPGLEAAGHDHGEDFAVK
jgi:hypothetical protein